MEDKQTAVTLQTSEIEELRKRLYRAYQLEWALAHEISIEEICCAAVDGTLDDNGLGGELWACYDEFVDTDYRDPDYIKMLLDMMDVQNDERRQMAALHESDLKQLERAEEDERTAPSETPANAGDGPHTDWTCPVCGNRDAFHIRRVEVGFQDVPATPWGWDWFDCVTDSCDVSYETTLTCDSCGYEGPVEDFDDN